MLGNSGDGGAAAAEACKSGGAEVGGDGGGGGPSSGGLSEEEKVRIEEGDRNSGGTRWPRQETLALLQIRSDMDVVFRDSSLKGPLWDEVSRKLAELGYNRSAKKCKEKFENVYKYHRRTKEGRSTKSDGKTYRFFDQLEALESQAPPVPSLPPPPRPQSFPPTAAATPVVTVAMPTMNPPIFSQLTVPSITNAIAVPQNTAPPPSIMNFANPPPLPQQSLPSAREPNPISFSYTPGMITSSHLKMAANLGSISTSSSSASTSSDDNEEPDRRKKRKRKWADFIQRVMSEVIEKQEEMQKKFLEALEKRERDRVAREEAWRAQEIARMNREHDLLVHERSIAAAKDAAVIAFLQKISDQQIPNVPQMQMQMQNYNSQPAQQPPQPQQPPPPPQLPPPQPQSQPQAEKNLDYPKTGKNGGESMVSSSRWPKAEVQALIRLRTNMDLKYQENGPKGPLWEEMSAAMRKLGYDRSAKRCKEKWENINKYFKKVKESNKKRPEDSKTCPYFHDLDVLYREKAKNENNNAAVSNSGFGAVKAEIPMVPIMVQPEQQWPLPPQPDTAMEDEECDQNPDDEEDGDDEDEEDEVGGYEVVANKPSSVGT